MQVRHRALSMIISLVILLESILYPQKANAQQQTFNCGTWSIKPESQNSGDTRIKITLVSYSSSVDCSANFLIENETSTLGLGGYSFELAAIAGSSDYAWTEPWQPKGPAFLLPSLNANVIITPVSKNYDAVVTIQGDVTRASFGFDSALFIVKSVLDIVAKGCASVPKDQIALMAIRVKGILNTAADLTFSGDIAGALKELRLILGEVIDNVVATATGSLVGCTISVLSPSKKIQAVLQISVDFLSWYPKFVWEYFHATNKKSTKILLIYTPITPTVAPIPTQIAPEPSPSITLDQTDLSSVVQWLEYSIGQQDLSLIRPLIGGKGVALAPYGSEFDFVGYDNSGEFIPLLSKALSTGTLSCLGYDNTPGDWAAIFFRGNVDWNSFPQKINSDSDGIIFGFLKLQQKWELAWVSKLPGSVLSYNREHGCPTLTATILEPIDQTAYFSVLQWIKYASLNNYISIFEILFMGDSIQFIDGNNVSVSINKTDFLAQLSKRLVNKPNCEYFMFDSSNKNSGRLIIRINNWSPGWDINGSTIVYLILEMKNNQWVLNSIKFGESPPSWAQNLERISFDTIPIWRGNKPEVVCKEVRPTRLKVGDFAFISFYPPLVQRVRSGPGTSKSVLTTIPIGSAVKILDGPQCVDNWIWWKIKVMSSKLEGWTAEGDKDAYWLIPCESRMNCGTR